MTLEIVDWLSFEEADKLPQAPDTEEHDAVLKAVIIARGIRNGGFWHQSEGCPVFSDGTALTISFRSWGAMLAEIWSEVDGNNYCYVDFAWTDGPEKADWTPEKDKRSAEFTRGCKDVHLAIEKQVEELRAKVAAEKAVDTGNTEISYNPC